MSTLMNVNAKDVVKVNTSKDIKDYLVEGAKVIYEFNGSEMVYVIEGVQNLEISTKGYILDKGEKKFPKESNDTVYISARKNFKALNIAYKALITYLNGYIPKGGLMLKLKDEDKGYTPDNIVMVNKFTGNPVDWNQLTKISLKAKASNTTVKTVEAILEDEDKTNLDPMSLYTKKESVLEYVAEDGMSFNTLEAAALHQRFVTEAKEAAQVVLEYNKELYGVAEKVFLQAMKYEGNKPYKNFIDVMTNFDGVTQQSSKEVVKFKEFALGKYPHLAHLFSDKSYSQEQADEIVGMLSLAQDVYLQLEMLSKQTV